MANNNRKNIWLLVGFIVLAGVAYWLVSTKSQPEYFNLEDRQFKVENINDVQTITIDRANYPSMTLSKKGGDWLINGRKKANPNVISNFKTLISNIEIDYIPTKAMTAAIMKNIEDTGVRIRIWDKDENLLKDYIVGSEIGSNQETPFLVTGKSQPYILRIPGFVGSLRTRYVYPMEDWKSIDVFVYNPEEIQSVTVVYDRDEDASFAIRKQGEEIFLTKPGSNTPADNFNPNTVKAYFSFFQDIQAEANDSENPNRNMIEDYQRFAKVIVEKIDGKSDTVQFRSYIDILKGWETKSPHQIHPDNKFFASTGNNEMLLVQQRVVWPVFRTYNYFLNK